MSFNKKFFTTGGIVASAPPAAAAFDPLQNFETVTYTGNGSTQKITGYIRKGAAFNGSSSKIDVPSITASSISFWVYLNNFSSTHALAGNSSDTSKYLYINTNGTVLVNTQTEITPSTSIQSGTWEHIAFTESGGTVTMYLNGQSVGSVSSSLGGWNQFGARTSGTVQYLDGKLDQIRIFNTALNPTQVGQLALETYADPKKSTTDYFGDGSGVALYELDEDANSSNFEQAAVFNGSSSYISGLNGVIPATTTDCTFSCWFNMSTGFSSNFKSILGGTGVDSLRITINYSSSGNYKIQPGRGISSNAFYSSSNWSATAILPNLWYHLVCVYTNSSNTMDVYLNNNLIDSEVLSTTTSSAVNTNLVLGYYRSDVGFSYWNGSIDQVRIYSSALGTGDVEKLYKESADVPTANLVAHYKLDGNAEDVLDTYDGTTSNVTYSTGVYGGTPTNVNFLGMAFQPDLVWIKSRDATPSHKLFDSVRGISKFLSSNAQDQEYTFSPYGLTSFDSNGFTIADITNGGYGVNGAPGQTYTGANADYVAWCWKAADTTTTISAGTVGNTIASDVRANQDAGFSIVKYTGNSSFGQSVGHGLSQAPEMIFFKNLSITRDWRVYNHSIGATKYLQLDGTGVGTFGSFNNTDPTSEVFYTTNSASADTATNNSGNNYIAYCFHSVVGYQKLGSYSGGSSGSGNVIYTTDDGTSSGSGGFKPRFLIVKRSDQAGDAWQMFDSIRGGGDTFDNYLQANEAYAEASYNQREVNFTDNGFYWTYAESGTNISGGTYIYLAIA